MLPTNYNFDDSSLDLVDLLLECHKRIRRFSGLAMRIALDTDFPDIEVTSACRDVMRYFDEALPLHVADEDKGIFPRLLGKSEEIDVALRTMVEQHQRHRPMLQELHDALDAVASSPSHREGREKLRTISEALEDELSMHLEIEETVIFPAVRDLLPTTVQQELVEELRKRRLKHGGAKN